ncbi:MAG TPA: hypothetical protein VNZ48_05335 [Xanthobacteraceae bacterium]|jgi:hypothetical protein|nr:hypothetical protein [Xanthobacteraceae bacterium]
MVFQVSAPCAARKGEQIFVIGRAAIVNGVRAASCGDLWRIYSGVCGGGGGEKPRYLLRTTSA